MNLSPKATFKSTLVFSNNTKASDSFVEIKNTAEFLIFLKSIFDFIVFIKIQENLCKAKSTHKKFMRVFQTNTSKS